MFGGVTTCLLEMVQVTEVNVDLRICLVTEGLTEDAVSARLHQGARCVLVCVYVCVCVGERYI